MSVARSSVSADSRTGGVASGEGGLALVSVGGASALGTCFLISSKRSLVRTGFETYPSIPASKQRSLSPYIAWAVMAMIDRKSTRLNSSHDQISYAVFCLKKKKNNIRFQLYCHHGD